MTLNSHLFTFKANSQAVKLGVRLLGSGKQLSQDLKEKILTFHSAGEKVSLCLQRPLPAVKIIIQKKKMTKEWKKKCFKNSQEIHKQIQSNCRRLEKKILKESYSQILLFKLN